MKEVKTLDLIKEFAEKVEVIDGKMYIEDGSNYNSHDIAVDYIYSNIYSQLNDEIDRLYLKGEIDFLCRINTILYRTKRNLQEELNNLEEKYNYENDFEAMLDGVNYSDSTDLKYIYKIKNKHVAELIDSIDHLKSPQTTLYPQSPVHINSSNTLSVHSNLNVPHSKTENNPQRIEQVTQDKREEDIRSHAPEAASIEKESKKVKPFFIPKCILEELENQVFIEDANENPITWLKNKQLLRELVMHKNIKKEKYSKADVERATPIYFIYKGQPAKLAKNKNIDTIERDDMLDILSQLDD